MSVNNTSGILQRVDNIVIVPVKGPVHDELIDNLCDSILLYLRTREAGGVIFDMSGIEVLDEYDFERMRKMVDTICLMGVKVMFAEIRPGVAASLAMLDTDISWPSSALNVELAMEKLK